jgi:hypothetical protein
MKLLMATTALVGLMSGAVQANVLLPDFDGVQVTPIVSYQVFIRRCVGCVVNGVFSFSKDEEVLVLTSPNPIPIPPVGSFIQDVRVDELAKIWDSFPEFTVVIRQTTDFPIVGHDKSGNNQFQYRTVLETLPQNDLPADSLASLIAGINGSVP